MIKRNKVAVAVATILASAMSQAKAQEAPDNSSSGNTGLSEPLEEVTITGLRRSLQEAMEIKRDAIGVVDAISAEDIGKFADANLSEALQRITGISIDRRNGEGALVTARGFGAQFNMVTLNGRQMPTADAYANGQPTAGGLAGNTRSFNFANLASEAISGIEVYKTGRADIATGGIGASINVKTARPFDNDGTIANVGIKLVNDTSNRVGDEYTPEVSGIFSYANDDKRWGVGLTASYQQRDSGSSGASINDWHIERWNADNTINQSVGPFSPSAQISGTPAIGQLYGVPNDIRYHFADRERERTNAQLAFQFAPMDALTLTADYTYAQTKLEEDRGDQTIWLQRNGFTRAEFDNTQSVATPTLLHEMTGTGKDFGYEQQHRNQKNDLKSLGFNANWRMNERLSFGLDVHDSEARSLPNDPLTGGGETTFALAGKMPDSTSFWTQTMMFNNGLPIAARTLYPNQAAAAAGVNGNPDFSFDANSLGTQVLRINFQDQVTEIQQARLDGALEFDNGRFQFGVETRAMDMRQRGSTATMTLGDWGVGDTGQIPGMVALLQPFSLVNAFDDFSAPGAPVGGWKGNANDLALWALGQYPGRSWQEPGIPAGQLSYNPGFATNNGVKEDTNALYVQFALKTELGSMPANVVLGARYEQTDVESASDVLVPTALVWQDDNDFTVQRPTTPTTFIEEADYSNLLPSLDFDLGLTDNLKARFSYSKTIARAGYGQLAADLDPRSSTGATKGGSTLNGFTAPGTANSPQLIPIESDNMDLALEYYFSNRGYVSVGFWDKRVSNFIGEEVTIENMFGIRDQTGGQRAQDAMALLQARSPGANIDDSALFTMIAMMENPGGFTDANGVFWAGGAANYDGTNGQHVAFATQYDVLPNADDPLMDFAVARPVNNRDARIYGWELGGQYFFGDTGFGIQANYTIVNGDIGYDNASDPSLNQFALLGLSDSANAVFIYEKFGFTARLAYNWRDEFLSSINVGQWRNPIFVEAYDQIDLSLGYDVNDNLTVSFEGLNLTEEDVRWHGRTDEQLWMLEDQGARYALGVRYRF